MVQAYPPEPHRLACGSSQLNMRGPYLVRKWEYGMYFGPEQNNMCAVFCDSIWNMRLFCAVLFDDEVLRQLISAREMLREHAFRGSFTPDENLHLTLEFLGECDAGKAGLIRQAMDEICFSPFVLSFRSLGFFRRDDGDIWFARADECGALIRLQSELHNALLKRGFRLERRKYRPHVTLARRAVLDEQALPSPAFSAEVTSFSLMLSEQKKGRMVYTPLYTVCSRDL